MTHDLIYVERMNKPKTIEENSKEVIANSVVTPTAKYFVPEYGEIEARDLDDVHAQLKKRNKKEVTHGNS